MRYLHLINDTLYTDFAVNIFEQCNPGNNTFLVGVKNADAPLKKTKQTNTIHIRKIRTKEYYQFIDSVDFDILVVHFMHDYKAIAVNQLKKDVKIIWLVWGGDIRLTKTYNKNIYQPHTKKVVDGIRNSSAKRIRSQLRDFYYFLLTGSFPAASFKKAVSKVDYCATVIPDEFDILCKEWDFFRAARVPFSYATIEDNFKNVGIDDYVDGNGILVGNSIDPSSNHFDALAKLKTLSITGRKIIVPLNYGEGMEYRDLLIKKGFEQFGDQFNPLQKMLPSAEYVKLLKSCDIALMLHERQQAMGNIISLLWLGSKIFMSENSVVYTYLRRKGFHIYSFQTELNNENINIRLTTEEVGTNRMLLIKEYGEDVVLNKAKTLVNIVSGKAEANAN